MNAKARVAAWARLPAGQPIDDGWCMSKVLGAGEGAMSVVLEVRKAPNFVDVLKIFAAEPMMESRFAAECALTVSLAHPNIVQIKDCRVLPEGLPMPKGTPYVRMERLYGVTVRALLIAAGAKRREQERAGRPRSPSGLRFSQVFQVAEEAGAALAFVHGRGVVHCDIKPENLFLHQSPHSPTTQIKLLDFGIAEVCGKCAETGYTIGSPRYMPPEAVGQDGRKAAPSPLFDVYALSMVIYEMLTLQSPWPIEIASSDDVLRAHDFRPVRPSYWTPELGEEIDELLLRGLSSDPACRPRVGELVEGLRPLLNLEGRAGPFGAGDVVPTDPGPVELEARAAADRPSSRWATPAAPGTWIDQARERQLLSSDANGREGPALLAAPEDVEPEQDQEEDSAPLAPVDERELVASPTSFEGLTPKSRGSRVRAGIAVTTALALGGIALGAWKAGSLRAAPFEPIRAAATVVIPAMIRDSPMGEDPAVTLRAASARPENSSAPVAASALPQPVRAARARAPVRPLGAGGDRPPIAMPRLNDDLLLHPLARPTLDDSLLRGTTGEPAHPADSLPGTKASSANDVQGSRIDDGHDMRGRPWTSPEKGAQRP